MNEYFNQNIFLLNNFYPSFWQKDSAIIKRFCFGVDSIFNKFLHIFLRNIESVYPLEHVALIGISENQIEQCLKNTRDAVRLLHW